MYRVIIAEDEMLVRLGLKNAVDWAKHNMQIIADVANGQDAWEVYRKEKPDLVLTDLKMPIMGGMELIEKIRQEDKLTKIVILTCLEEFELIRQAVSLGISDYIVKLSMSTAGMDGVLGKLEQELNHTHRDLAKPGKLDIDVIKDNLLKDFLFRNRYTAEEFARRTAELGLRFTPKRTLVCLLDIEPFERLQEKFRDDKGQLIRMSLLNVLDEVLHMNNRGEAFFDERNRYILLLSFEDKRSEQEIEQTMERLLSHIRKTMQAYFNVTVTFGISTMQSGCAELRPQYYEAMGLLDSAFYLGGGRTYRYSSAVKLPEAAADKLRELPVKWAGVAGDAAGREAAKQLEAFLANGVYRSGAESRKAFMLLLHASITQLGLSGEYGTQLFSEFGALMSRAASLTELAEVYGRFIESAATLRQGTKRYSKEVSELLRLIRLHYADELSLQWAERKVSLSASYISKLFKKETGLNFIDYVVQVRIEKAKEHLLGSHMKSYEIAEVVGFDNHSYFSRVFKKTTGLNPREFRKRWGLVGEEEDEEESGILARE